MESPSPADIRNDLDPDAVDALADQLHTLSCVPLAGQPQEWPTEHRGADRSKARFVLMGLRDDGRIPEMPAADLTANIIDKVDAGALLTFAVWTLPKDTAIALFKEASPGFTKAYMAATAAYGVGGN